MLSNDITIIIPCKNEKENIFECVSFIAKQSGITGTKIIIADCSDEAESIGWLSVTESTYKYTLNIEVIRGGFPAKARLDGSKLVKTPYMLFLDADIMLKDRFILARCLSYQEQLVTVPFVTEKGFNWIFRLFDIQQWCSQLLGVPFAIGGFQLWRTSTYWECGGYDETHLFAEDFALSKKVENIFVIKTKGVWTSARRFKKKGFFYMMWISTLCYINRNNNSFFQKHHNYWI